MANEKRKDVLLCCTEGSAFTFTSKSILENPGITYDNLKQAIKREFCGEEYKRTLQAKLRNLRFRKGMKVTSFAHELRTIVSELYAIQEKNAVEAIATNHVLSALDNEIRKEVQILQLAGNTKLENLLEMIEAKLEGNPLTTSAVRVEQSYTAGAVAATATSMPFESRMDKLERMMEKVMDKLESRNAGSSQQFKCDHCGKAGHTKQRCFLLKTCFVCKKTGHISKFCKQNRSNTESRESAAPNTSAVGGNNDVGRDINPGKRIMFKVQIGGKSVEFLYDPGSQFTIISREVYDGLAAKPPLQPMTQSGNGKKLHSMA